jgi:predicted metal-dependent peptidase
MSTQLKTRWDALSLSQRIAAVGNDILKHPYACRVAGVMVMGQATLDANIPTACTNGRDEKYNPDFITPMSRKQLRYLRFHELMHKYLKHHMPAYRSICKKHPDLSNMAMDYVINGFIESTPGAHLFFERPSCGALVDPRFDGMSWLEVLKVLIDMQKGGQGQGQQGGNNTPNERMEGGKAISPEEALQGQGGDDDSGGFDEHDFDNVEELTPDEQAALDKALDDAINQGEMLHRRALSKLGSGGAVHGVPVERHTDWRPVMREFITDTCQGDDEATYSPPNRRFLPLDLLMPSVYSEAMEELVVAADTSGSMGHLYPTMFGEVAQILRTVKPAKVHVLWWDTKVADAQTFTEQNYDDIATLLKPAGGGGTSPQCVLDYMSTNNINPAAIIWLTDGYIDSFKTQPTCPSLWGVLDNERFTPPFGKVVHVSSVSI